MTINENNIVGELVAKDYRTASVFKANNIDFCCGGNISIGDVCEKNQIEPENLVKELNQVLQTNGLDETTDFQSWPIDLLADYIEKKHHRYVETKILEIKPFLEKVRKVHGHRHPELIEIDELFSGSAGALTAHMKKEEFILFPYIRKMVQAKDGNLPIDSPQFATVQNPVAAMMDDHDNEGERFRKIQELTNNYQVPEDACTTYRVSFAMLEEFENDLHMHIHLENNILFPRAIQMEKELASVKV